MAISFTYGETTINRINVIMAKKTKKKDIPVEIQIDGESLVPTKRLWKSLQMRFRFNDNVFKYFKPEEVFQRIAEVTPQCGVRYCIERIDANKPRLLAVTNPASPVIPYNNLCEILNKYGTNAVSYADGVVRSTHDVQEPMKFQIMGDDFQNRFVVDTPIDGFGKPQIYLSLLRQICKNGMVGYSPTFRSELVIGKKNDTVEFSLMRALESYNNEDGFIALKQRFETAARSWASVREAVKLQNLVLKLYNQRALKVPKLILGSAGSEGADIPIYKDLINVTGNLNQIYGLANIDALSIKRQRTLPSGASVYDLLNFASEIATHHSHPAGARSLQAYVGDIISEEFDLELSKDIYSDYRDFFISDSKTTDTMKYMNSVFEN